MSEDIESLYKTITDNILSTRGQCVLILGPELSVNKGGVGYKKYFREIIKKSAPKSKYLGRDNLFYFNDSTDENKIVRQVSEFYEEVGDPVLLEMISRIEFPLIINVCPDIALNKVYNAKNIKFKDGYFTKESIKEFKSLPIPTKRMPVIYNIFGVIGVDQSLIFTHSKLYQSIQDLLPEKSTPVNIEYYVKNTANSFLFLGFKFDSWYYQLICHKLGLQPKKNICTPFINESENVGVIMKKSFNMNFTTENSMECIHNIIKRCGDKLRKPSPTGRYSTFISYAWNDKANNNKPGVELNERRENIVNLIQQEFNKKEEGETNLYTLFRDRDDLSYGDSIDSFMHTIGAGKTVIIVVTDKYLKSEYCMIEALRVLEYNDPEKRVFIILMADASRIIKDETAKKELEKTYKKYWYDKSQVLLNDPNKLGRMEFNNCVKIYRFVDEFILRAGDKKNFSISYDDVILNTKKKYEIVEQRKDEFSDLMKTIKAKLKEN